MMFSSNMCWCAQCSSEGRIKQIQQVFSYELIKLFLQTTNNGYVLYNKLKKCFKLLKLSLINSNLSCQPNVMKIKYLVQVAKVGVGKKSVLQMCS